MNLIFASNNVHKHLEIQAQLGADFKLLSLSDIGYTAELPETGNTLEHNARQKAETIFNAYGEAVIADDSGLEVVALNNAPGVHSSYYSGSRDDARNMQKVLDSLIDVYERSARFKTVLAYVSKDENVIFQGVVLGKIVDRPKGANGFGYDPLFVPEGDTRTFGEMTTVEKSMYSHRIRALQKFVDYLQR